MLNLPQASQTIDVPELPETLKNLILSIEKHPPNSPRNAEFLLRQHALDPQEIRDWAERNNIHETDGLVRYDGGFFEIVVTYWYPGRYSAIHNHALMDWGAFHAFGPLEIADFFVCDNEISTLAREVMLDGNVLAIGSQRIHQLGNPSDTSIWSLHILGTEDGSQPTKPGIEIYDLENRQVKWSESPFSFALPRDGREAQSSPIPDYTTSLRHTVELIKTCGREMVDIKTNQAPIQWSTLTDKLFHLDQWDSFEKQLMRRIDTESGHARDLAYWKTLREDLKAAALLEKEILSNVDQDDPFVTYAELYDDVIGAPCLDQFMADYISFSFEKCAHNPANTRVLSLGCGTGLMEAHIVNTHAIARENLLGIDLSAPMVRVAQRKINAQVLSVLDAETLGCNWDMTFSGLNVFQYLKPGDLETAIKIAAKVTKDGGYFVGDFITPDHIRRYPHVIPSKTGNVISLRNPVLVQRENRTFQQSEIINVNRRTGKMVITYEGKHLRYLPALHRMRQNFKNAFGGPVEIYDAVSLEPLSEEADTCPSTRYLIIAQKAG